MKRALCLTSRGTDLLLTVSGLLLMSANALAGTYYIAASGSDSNNGTGTATPWLHAPGMPKCTANCASHTPVAGDRFIFRGGDTWHFGNPSAAPYTGGTWSFKDWWGTRATCIYQGAQTGCIYYGVDQTWFAGGSWARPILTGDNPTSASPVATCTYQTAGGTNAMVITAPNSIFDNFELTGLCGTTESASQGTSNTHIAYYGTGIGGDGTSFLTNLYIHGWTETTAIVNANKYACNILGGGYNGLQVITTLVIDGSDSNAGVCTWGQYPSFYHFTDSIIRYTSDGVGQWCHDVHDVIFEHIVSLNNKPGANHTNIFECNVDSTGNAPGQPQNTPNVFYNNIVRHSESDVGVWFCPNTMPEYWFNNLFYDVRGEGLSVAGPSQYPGCTHTGGQWMFNNTFVDLGQPLVCHGTGSDTTGGIYLTALNNHLINTTWDGTGCTGGASSATNVSLTTATASSQGYVSGAGTYRTSNCASDSTKPCAPTVASAGTVGTGGNHQAYCTALAAFSSEYAIGIQAASACKYGTTDGCGYDVVNHKMNCPAQTAMARPSSGAWDAGAYQYDTGNLLPDPPSSLVVVVH